MYRAISYFDMATLASILCSAALVAAAEQPNIIILLADDMGWGDMSLPLGASPAQTPNLNAMASSPNAAHFPRFYSGGPVCSPTRATVLTGRTNTRDCIINVERTALPTQIEGATIADYAKRAGYSTFFAGKWHLGSMTNDTSSGSCYPSPANNTCLPGYIAIDAAHCCDGRDAHLPQRTPLDFGFDVVFATSQVAPSSTSNCGCLETVPGAGVDCNLGHYGEPGGHTPAWVPGLECDQTWYTTPNGTWAPYKEVTDVDDAGMLIDHLLTFINSSVSASQPFLAQVSFHQVHIPYIAPQQYRDMYKQYDLNHQDYYGALTAMDAAIGRLRAALVQQGIADNTLVAFTADNGPENSIGGHETSAFPNPGITNGLQGRKRALLEGGIRVAGIVEAPFLVSGRGPYVLPSYPASTMDLLPTVLDLLGASNVRPTWPLDGRTLVPALNGSSTVRGSAIGHLSNFTLEEGNATCPHGPPALPPNCPTSFSTPMHQAQASWMEGHLKLHACVNEQKNWRFRLFNVTSDQAETTDLLPSNPTLAGSMYANLQAWMDSVAKSTVVESQCAMQS